MCEQSDSSWLQLSLAERARKLAEDIAEREQDRIQEVKAERIRMTAEIERRAKVSEERSLARELKRMVRVAKLQRRAEREERIRMHEERMMQDALVARQERLAFRMKGKIPAVIAPLEPEYDPAVLATPRAPDDPWTIIRQRHYSKPQYLGSLLRQPSDMKKMAGRAR